MIDLKPKFGEAKKADKDAHVDPDPYLAITGS